MKAAIYDQYLDILGGGERYVATVAEALETWGYEVEFWWREDFRDRLNRRFGLNLKTSRFVDFDPLRANLVQRLIWTAKYDLLFWVGDGSIPTSLAKKTLIHMQIPANWQGCGTWANKLKAKFYRFVCNSKFTKSVVDPIYGMDSRVIYPPVSVELFRPGQKKKHIVSIGRLAHLLHAKRQDILIKAFAKISPNLPGWKLILAGGSEDDEYLRQLEQLGKSMPVEIIPNPSLELIRQLLGEATIFWSATGYGVDPKEHPEKMEHFGISTVEAMAAGAVPLVTGSGGHLETVVDGQTGFWWQTEKELGEKTLRVIRDAKLLVNMAQMARERRTLFSKERFYDQLRGLI